MVDRSVLAAKVAAIRDAVARIREVLPSTTDALLADRTAREVIALNLLVALQDCIDLGAHWLADDGLDVPESYRAIFEALGRRGVLDADLALRLADAGGFRNPLVHRYGGLDWRLVDRIARDELDALDAFCSQLARRAPA